ncbi:MAG: primosomal protein N', partial [Bacillota bacterium]
GGSRRQYWDRVLAGQARVVIGARSAVLAPVQDAGLFILDEEHEASYKQEEAPRYHARDVAIHRAREAGAPVVLGSATPSLESFHASQQGEYRLLRLPERVDRRPMPLVTVVDLREELASTGEVSPLSRPLREALRQVMAAREQAILFVNRRGFSGAMVCRECGFAWRCPHCDVGLTYHHRPGEGVLRCHYCGYETQAASRCPRCGGTQMAAVGFGTQKVQAALAAAFPGVPVLRMDADTTTRRDAHRHILEAFARTAPAVLVGTQMVAKGHDFPRVTLAAAVLADVTLQLPDFRAAERTFQHLVQVAGRSGRGDRPGHVIVQTFQPHHYSIQAAATGGAQTFYARELAFRRRLHYPPFGELVRLVAQDPDEDRARLAAVEAARQLEEAGRRRPGVKVLGPAPAPIARLRDRFRWQVVVRGPAPEARTLTQELLDGGSLSGRSRPESLIVDPDPVSVL